MRISDWSSDVCSSDLLPTDLLGLTCVRYDEAIAPAEMNVINQKLGQAIKNEGRLGRIEGLWWQFSLTARTEREPSAVSILNISRGGDGALEIRSEEHTSELQSLMRISYAVFCLKKKNKIKQNKYIAYEQD